MDNGAFFGVRATSVISENCDYLGKIGEQRWATVEMWELQISQILQSILFCSLTFKVADRKIIKCCCQDLQSKLSRAKKIKKRKIFRGVLATEPHQQLFPWLEVVWHRWCRSCRTVTPPKAPPQARAQQSSDFPSGFRAPEQCKVASALASW